jgi:hypothetical protein
MTDFTNTLDEIEKGLRGVTKGPWRSETGANSHVFSEIVMDERDNAIAFSDDENRAHIARLDPDTVRELVRFARIGIAAEEQFSDHGKFYQKLGKLMPEKYESEVMIPKEFYIKLMDLLADPFLQSNQDAEGKAND